jgi:hypothetical protein
MKTDLPVIHAVPQGTVVLDCTNLETGERALVLTEPAPRSKPPQPVSDAWPSWFVGILEREKWRAPR